MTHIHRRFIDEQMRSLFGTYEEGHRDRSQVEETPVFHFFFREFHKL